MRHLLLFFLLLVTGFFVYQIYRILSPSLSTTPTAIVPPSIRLDNHSLQVGNFAKVLGTATTNLLHSGQTLLNQVTDDQAEPIINQTVENLKNQIKDLPQEQYLKVKTEFCRDVLPSPSPELDL